MGQETANETTVDEIWLNAFSCVNPTDEFVAEVGRSIIDALKSAPRPDKTENPLAPYWQVTLKISAS